MKLLSVFILTLCSFGALAAKLENVGRGSQVNTGEPNFFGTGARAANVQDLYGDVGTLPAQTITTPAPGPSVVYPTDIQTSYVTQRPQTIVNTVTDYLTVVSTVAHYNTITSTVTIYIFQSCSATPIEPEGYTYTNTRPPNFYGPGASANGYLPPVQLRAEYEDRTITNYETVTLPAQTITIPGPSVVYPTDIQTSDVTQRPQTIVVSTVAQYNTITSTVTISLIQPCSATPIELEGNTYTRK